MASVVEWKLDRAADVTHWDSGQESEQSPTVDDGERWLSQLFRGEFNRLRKLAEAAEEAPRPTPQQLQRAQQARKTLKLIGLLALVEVMKWPIETVCRMISPEDHAAMGNATCERWLTAARKYLQLRLPKISDEVYDLVKPSRELCRKSRNRVEVSAEQLEQLDSAARRQRLEWADEFLEDFYAATGERPQSPLRKTRKPVVVEPESKQLSLFG